MNSVAITDPMLEEASVSFMFIATALVGAIIWTGQLLEPKDTEGALDGIQAIVQEDSPVKPKHHSEIEKLMGKPITYPESLGMKTPECMRLDQQTQSGLRCGPNAVYCLLGIFDRPVDYQTLIDEVDIQVFGTTLADLVTLARSKGLQCEPRKLSVEELWNTRWPSIVHLESYGELDAAGKPLNHFAVFCPPNGARVAGLVDSSSGLLRDIRKQELIRNFSGYCLIVDDRMGTANFEPRLLVGAVVGLILVSVVRVKKCAGVDRRAGDGLESGG